MGDELKQRAEKIVRLLHEDPDAIYSVEVPQDKWAKAYLEILADATTLARPLKSVPRATLRSHAEAQGLELEDVIEARERILEHLEES